MVKTCFLSRKQLQSWENYVTRHLIICTCLLAGTIQHVDHILIVMCRTYLYNTVKVKQSLYCPEQTLRVPGGYVSQFQDNRHVKLVRFSALCTGLLYPREIFLLGSESTPGPQSGRKDYVNEKFQWHIRTHDLSACREMPQPTAIRRAPYSMVGSKYLDGKS